MKKNLVFFALIVFTFGFSQCYVDGSPTVYVGETQTYTVKNNVAKCATCYSWSATEGNINIKTSKTENLEITGLAEGTSMIFLTMQTAKGEARCNKNISILPAVIRENPDCDVYYSGFSEKKSGEGQVTFVHKKSDAYSYRWTALFDDGTSETSTDAFPTFKFTKNNQIAKISVQILAEQCMRTYSKTYEKNFWTYF